MFVCIYVGIIRIFLTPAGSLEAEKQSCIDTISQLTKQKVHAHTHMHTHTCTHTHAHPYRFIAVWSCYHSINFNKVQDVLILFSCYKLIKERLIKWGWGCQ